MQAFEWASIKHLWCGICAIQENDNMLTESNIRSDLTQLHPELCASLQDLLCLLLAKILKITHHHLEFWLQVVTIDNELDTDNIIILTEYLHDILLTAITPYNKQDLIQWYKTNR